MKKLLILLVAVMAGVATISAEIIKIQYGDLYYRLDTESQTAEVTYEEYEMGYISLTNAIISDTVEYDGVRYGVTSIGEMAFMNSQYLESISIPSTVTSIKNNAICCPKIFSITIPSTVTEIEEWAFCSGNVIYNGPAEGAPWGATCVNGTIDGYLLFKDESKTELLACNESATGHIDIPSSVTVIGDYAFADCSNISSITIPDGVTDIGVYAFRRCSNLTTVTFPNSIVNVAESSLGGLFADCDKIASPIYNNHIFAKLPSGYEGAYAIPTGITEILGSALYQCRSLSSVSIPNSVTKIGSYAFYSCSELVSIEIPDKIERIEAGTFDNCSKLRPVAIPSTVTFIGSSAFANNKWINCEVPATVATIESYAFYGILNVQYAGAAEGAPWGAKAVNGYLDGYFVFSDEQKTELVACSTAAEGDVVIPSSTVSINDEAFAYCRDMTSVTFTENVTTIGEKLFRGCDKLDSVAWKAKHCQDFTDKITPFYSYSVYSYNRYDIRDQIKAVSFGDEVEYVPAYLCYGMKMLSDIVLQNCHTQVGNMAFSGRSYTAIGAYNIVLPDTTLCDGEDLYIDGVKCELSKTLYSRRNWIRKLQTVEGCDSTITISVMWTKSPSTVTCTAYDAYDTPNSGRISMNVQNGRYDYYTLNGEKDAILYNLSAGDYRLVLVNKACDDSIVKQLQIEQYGMRINNQYFVLVKENHAAYLTYRGTSFNQFSNTYSGNVSIPKTVTFQDEEYTVAGINYGTFVSSPNVTSLTLLSEEPIEFPEMDHGLNTSIPVYVPFGALSTYQKRERWKDLNLHVINPSQVAASNSTPTSITISLGSEEYAAHITSCGMEGSGEAFDGNVMDITGLEPNKDYKNVIFFANTREGDHDTIHYSFSTLALTLATQKAKVVSENVAILLAETNMSDSEMNCGFEWMRSDAPEGYDPNQVSAPVANGIIAGRLAKLKEEVYYKYRAYYKSASGQMYYGDWKIFFTGDIDTEFTPIVYTYAATGITEDKATLKGCAIAGAEDFDEQGFEVWAESRVAAQHAPVRMKAAIGEHHTIPASGMTMIVTLTDLDAGTVYKYCTYAKTGDEIRRGAEMSFTTQGEYQDTGGSTDIDQVTNDQITNKVIRNGQLLILRDGKTYTITGQELK